MRHTLPTSGMHRHWGGGGGGASLSEIIFAKETAAVAMAKIPMQKSLKLYYDLHAVDINNYADNAVVGKCLVLLM